MSLQAQRGAMPAQPDLRTSMGIQKESLLQAFPGELRLFEAGQCLDGPELQIGMAELRWPSDIRQDSARRVPCCFAASLGRL